MRLIFLHGPPAVEKLTVGQALATMIPAPLLDNHTTIDLGREIFDFGTPPFWDLVYQLRLDIIEAAARARVPYLITTACYTHPGDAPLIDSWRQVLRRHGATLIPVHLTCAPDTLAVRVTAPERAARGKLCSRQGLGTYLAKHDIHALPDPACVTVDTDALPPDAAAAWIMAHCGLHPA